MHEDTHSILLQDLHKRHLHGHRDILELESSTNCFSIIGYSANAIFIPKSILKAAHDIREVWLC